MGKTKSNKQKQRVNKMDRSSSTTPEQLYTAAITFAEQSQPEQALEQGLLLWDAVKNLPATSQLPALNLLGEINVELGDVQGARKYFEQAVNLDPEGAIPETSGGGAEKFLWLAQLCDAGGRASVNWFERGVLALQKEIAELENTGPDQTDEDTLTVMRVEKKKKLANALCGIIEVYMTDLSWEDDAEARCEKLITQAMSVEDDTSPEVLQTLASIRLSQERKDDAQAALLRSVNLWKDLDPEDMAVPDFATRISLSRLLMEAELEETAMSVIERLISEDDSSIEAWYLGGWCQYLMGQQSKSEGSLSIANGDTPSRTLHLQSSRHWLKQSLKLYHLLDYEDEKLSAHAQELVAELDGILGPDEETTDGQADEFEEWSGIEDALDDQDEEMKDS